MYYIIYKITNNLNNMIYIGCHKTDNLDDGYMGSGKLLKQAQKKYGLINFKKEIIHIFDNIDDMFYAESLLVNEDFVARKDTYNLKEGGKNWDYSTSLRARIIANNNGALEKAQESLKIKFLDSEWVEQKNKKFINTMYEKYGENAFSTFKGKCHSDEAKKAIGEKNSKHQSGSGNSQYGSMWITNGIENKKIPKDCEIPVGWKKGRKIKAGLV